MLSVRWLLGWIFKKQHTEIFRSDDKENGFANDFCKESAATQHETCVVWPNGGSVREQTSAGLPTDSNNATKIQIQAAVNLVKPHIREVCTQQVRPSLSQQVCPSLSRSSSKPLLQGNKTATHKDRHQILRKEEFDTVDLNPNEKTTTEEFVSAVNSLSQIIIRQTSAKSTLATQKPDSLSPTSLKKLEKAEKNLHKLQIQINTVLASLAPEDESLTEKATYMAINKEKMERMLSEHVKQLHENIDQRHHNICDTLDQVCISYGEQILISKTKIEDFRLRLFRLKDNVEDVFTAVDKKDLSSAKSVKMLRKEMDSVMGAKPQLKGISRLTFRADLPEITQTNLSGLVGTIRVINDENNQEIKNEIKRDIVKAPEEKLVKDCVKNTVPVNNMTTSSGNKAVTNSVENIPTCLIPDSVMTFEDCENEPTCFALLQDGSTWVAYGGREPYLDLLDSNGNCVNSVNVGFGTHHIAMFGPDKLLLASSSPPCLHLMDWSWAKTKFYEPNSVLSCVAVGRTGIVLATDTTLLWINLDGIVNRWIVGPKNSPLKKVCSCTVLINKSREVVCVADKEVGAVFFFEKQSTGDFQALAPFTVTDMYPKDPDVTGKQFTPICVSAHPLGYFIAILDAITMNATILNHELKMVYRVRRRRLARTPDFPSLLAFSEDSTESCKIWSATKNHTILLSKYKYDYS